MSSQTTEDSSGPSLNLGLSAGAPSTLLVMTIAGSILYIMLIESRKRWGRVFSGIVLNDGVGFASANYSI